MNIVVEAIQWTGKNYWTIRKFTRGNIKLRKDGRLAAGNTTIAKEGWVIRDADDDFYVIEDKEFKEFFTEVE
jgi:cephalosporin-C deacetylase-like acetyl esterase